MCTHLRWPLSPCVYVCAQVEFWGSYQNEQAAKQAYNAAALYHNLGGGEFEVLFVPFQSLWPA